MLRHTALLVATLLLLATVKSGSVVAQKKAKRRSVTKVVYVWEPTPGSAFHKFTRALPKVDKVELSQIAGREGQAAEESIVFGKQRVRIFSSKSLIGVQAEKFAEIWRRQKQGVGMACFAPAFLLRFYVEEKLYFETIVCFHCHNLVLSDDEEFWGFDAAGKEGQELLNAIKGLLPPMG
jgi:hypothetical protein